MPNREPPNLEQQRAERFDKLLVIVGRHRQTPSPNRNRHFDCPPVHLRRYCNDVTPRNHFKRKC